MTTDQFVEIRALWPTLTARRAEIYRWFASIFAFELTEEQIEAYQKDAISPLIAFLSESGFTLYTEALQRAIGHWAEIDDDIKTIQLELAADFAALFLLDGKRAALPYASYYLEEDGHLFGQIETAMQGLLADNQLAVDKQFNEPADHLAVILTTLAEWNSKAQAQAEAKIEDVATAQIQYIDDVLLSWLPQFVERGENIVVKSTFYSAVMKLLFAYLEADRQFLEEMGEGE